jgi:NADH-quinone oxidoreductase subunit M
MDSTVLILLLLSPILGGLISFFLKGNSSWFLGVITSMATILLSLLAYTSLPADGYLLYQTEWIPTIGANFNLSFHALSFLMCLLTGLVFLLSIVFVDVKNIENPSRFYGLMMLSQAGLLGVFLANDAFLFYIFWELALIPVYFLCSMYGGANRIKASFKFFIYTFIGSLLMLVAIIYIHQQGASQNFSWEIFTATGNGLPLQTQIVLFAMFFIAFAIKMPIFPFHTWQPDTYQQSSTPVTIILSAVMVKMGLFAIITWLLPVLQLAAEYWKESIMILSVISIVYASCMALVQSNVKRLVAYSSVAHIGLMCAALFSYPILGEEHIGASAVALQMFNHGINILGLWLLVYIAEKRFGTQDLREMGGIAKVAPVFTTALVIISFANIGLPLTNSFPAEFIMFTALFTSGSTYAVGLTVFAGLGIILSAVYTLRMIQQVAFGPADDKKNSLFKDLDWSQTIVMAIVVTIILIIGFYPNLIFNLINTMH